MQELNKYKYNLLGKWPQRYKAFNLQLQENKELKTWLTNAGFFDFNIKNNGYLVYYHQIVAYFNCGGIHAFKRGFQCDSSEVEIHHLNGNTLNNDPNNLVYIPRLLHTEISTIQRRLCKYIKTFRGSFKGCGVIQKLKDIPFWNKQGRLITNIKHFVMYVLIRTVKSSSITFKKLINISGFKKWLKKTSNSLDSFFPLYHHPITWLI
jgi:hypothetical protein